MLCLRYAGSTQHRGWGVQVPVTQRDKEACVQRYDDAFTFFHGGWDAALDAGYTCARPRLAVS
jgi:hypothetical protein